MTYTILIVEDEYLVRQGLTKLVNVAAYDMEIIGQAENGRQAWELIQKQVPDIILTDINMPHLNGIQLASLVRETYPQLDKEEKEEQLQDLLTNRFEGNMAQKIQSHLADSQFSLKSLASDLGFSPTYLSSLIKKELGLPFQDYLVRERVKQAKLLLLTTDLKIYEIAEKVGFEDMNYFTQRFKQIAGVTPRQFKKGEDR